MIASSNGIEGVWNFQPVTHGRAFVGVTVLQAATSDATLNQILQLLLAVVMMNDVRFERVETRAVAERTEGVAAACVMLEAVVRRQRAYSCKLFATVVTFQAFFSL